MWPLSLADRHHLLHYGRASPEWQAYLRSGNRPKGNPNQVISHGPRLQWVEASMTINYRERIHRDPRVVGGEAVIKEHMCNETRDEVVLIKDASGRVIGVEKLNFSIPDSEILRVIVEAAPV